jgi:hypothetical protein
VTIYITSRPIGTGSGKPSTAAKRKTPLLLERRFSFGCGWFLVLLAL